MEIKFLGVITVEKSVIWKVNVTIRIETAAITVELGVTWRMIVVQRISRGATRRAPSLDLQERQRYLTVPLELFNLFQSGKKVEIKGRFIGMDQRALGAGLCLMVMLDIFSFFGCSSLDL